MLKKLLASLLCGVMVAQAIPVYALTALPKQSYEGVQEEDAYPDQYAIPYEDGSIEPTWIPNPHTIKIVGGIINNIHRYDNDRQGNEYDDHTYDGLSECSDVRGKDIVHVTPLCGLGPTSNWTRTSVTRAVKTRAIYLPEEIVRCGLAAYARRIDTLQYQDKAAVVAAWCIHQHYQEWKVARLCARYHVDAGYVWSLCDGSGSGALFAEIPNLNDNYVYEMPETENLSVNAGVVEEVVVQTTEWTPTPFPAMEGRVCIGGYKPGGGTLYATGLGLNQTEILCQHTNGGGNYEHDLWSFYPTYFSVRQKKGCKNTIEFDATGWIKFYDDSYFQFPNGNAGYSGRVAVSTFGGKMMAIRAASEKNYSMSAFPSSATMKWDWTNGNPGWIPPGYEQHNWNGIVAYRPVQ